MQGEQGSVVIFCCFLDKKQRKNKCKQKEWNREKVWQDVGVFEQELGVAKPLGVIMGRIGKQTANHGSNDSADIKSHGQDGKSPRLVFFLVTNDLGNNSAHNANVAVKHACQKSACDGPVNITRKTKHADADGSTDKPEQQGWLATKVITEPAPENACERLAKGKRWHDKRHQRRDSGGVIVAKVANHKVNVGRDRRECKRLSDPTEHK